MAVIGGVLAVVLALAVFPEPASPPPGASPVYLPRADTPASANPGAPRTSTPLRNALFRADLNRLVWEYAIRVPKGSRFECAVVRPEGRR